ncbi:MAG: hypothetical protein J6A33_00085 [Alphaproteobacteria bacterium]|nr:hypothetical protein [Alphaproteobacteria bacterium]
MKRTFAKIFFMFFCGFAALPLCAAERDYSDYFQIDLDMKLPTLAELQKKYVINQNYDRKYEFYWNIGNVFDNVFRATISTYGMNEKRLKNENEEALIEMLKGIPPEYYQYIGPYLHTVPNISEKVLNMPGIKETKNQFPTRIAPQLADIEDLEFLSPYLYFVLMPEAWPEYHETTERPAVPIKKKPKVEHDEKFYSRIKELVPVDEFLPDAQKPKTGMSDLRTIEPTKDSPLTSADVKAFMATLDKVYAFGKHNYNVSKIYDAGFLLDVWEQEHGSKLAFNMLKDVVNPCQRLVQKIRIAGLEREFRLSIAEQGFDVKGWAYTCDKTIKAFRVSNISRATVATIKAYEKGLYDSYFDQMGDKKAEMQYQAMQSLVEMNRAPLEDVLEVRKNREELRQKLNSMKNRIIAVPVGS